MFLYFSNWPLRWSGYSGCSHFWPLCRTLQSRDGGQHLDISLPGQFLPRYRVFILGFFSSVC